MSPTTEVEVVPDANAELAVITQKYDLAPKTAADLRAEFAPLFKEASELVRESHDIVVTDASQKLKIQQAALCRKALKTNRLAAEKLKDSLKRDSLRYSNAVQGLYNYHLLVVSAEEERLEKQEKFVAIKEAERKAALSASRQAALAPFGLDTSFMQLGEMPDETFAQLLENTRAGHEAKLATERKAQEDRIRVENERLREEARIREENAKLQREAKEREEAAKVEHERFVKEKADAAAAALAEIQRREALAAEERRKHEEAAAEIRRVADENAAKTKAEADAREKAQQEAAEAALQAERSAAAKAKAETEKIVLAAQLKAAQDLLEAGAKAKAQREAAEAVLKAERARLEAIAAEERRKVAKAMEEAADKAKAERDAAIEANRQERLRLQALAEVERQKQETARKAAEAQAAVERAAREKLEVEAAMRAREEAMRKAKEAEVARKAALAPDRDKLLGVAQVLRTLDVPKVTSDAAKDVVVELLPRLTKLAAWIETECKLL